MFISVKRRLGVRRAFASSITRWSLPSGRASSACAGFVCGGLLLANRVGSGSGKTCLLFGVELPSGRSCTSVILEALQSRPDRRRIRAHVRSQPSIEALEFPTLLARRVGEPVSLAASEILPPRRQVESFATQTLGQADLKTTSVYAHARLNESSSRYLKSQ